MSKAITLLLMSEKGLRSLQALIASGKADALREVIVGQDKAMENDYSEEIRVLAGSAGIPCYDRKSHPPILSQYAIAVSWRWLIPVEKSAARLIVLHDSILPRYRGFAPLVNQLINGEPELGVTALFANDEGFDTGEILLQEKIRIAYPMKISEAISAVAPLYEKTILKLVSQISEGKPLQGIPQDEKMATYSVWRDAGDYHINWNLDAERIKRTVDALGYPFSGAASFVEGRLLRILAAEVVPDVKIENRDPGKVMFMRDGKPVVICGTGLLKIMEAKWADDGTSLFPLEKFRTRFE